MRLYVCAIALAVLGSAGPRRTAAAPAALVCKADAGWDDPATPLRVYGNTWYVRIAKERATPR